MRFFGLKAAIFLYFGHTICDESIAKYILFQWMQGLDNDLMIVQVLIYSLKGM